MSSDPAFSPRPIMANTLLRSFGRVKGRVLGAVQQQMVNELLPHYLITDLQADPASLFDKPYKEYVVEIGFGGGEHLAHQASLHPEIGYIGCEPYMNGIALLLQQIKEKKLTNIRIFRGDARVLLQSFNPGCLSQLFILFPDPWPKKKHHKKRLISDGMPALLANMLKPGGKVLLATDHKGYAGWMLSFMLNEERLQWNAKKKADWETPPANWIQTRYQQKALQEGRNAVFLSFSKLY